MRTIGRLMSAVALLTAGALVMSPAASADSLVPQPDYEAAYAAAADASGVFASGTTVTIVQHGGLAGDFDVTVNADGSLVGERADNGATTRVRCVRVDRCWEQDPTAFGDVKWHRLPAGSITYQLGRDYWSTWMGFPWPAGARFALGTAEDGTPLYMVGYDAGGMMVVNVAYFEGPSVSNVVMLVDDVGMTPTREGQMTASTTRVVVAPPAKKSIGTPATQLDAWTVPINS